MNNIYSLVSINENEYIQAISYDKRKLENILQSDQLANFVIKDNTQIYKLYFINELGKMLLIPKKDKKNITKLYGFNKISTKGCENILLDLSDVKYEEVKKIFEFNLSSNEILFDVYYDEGIMNA
jgi:hypothetical protein